MYSRGKRLKDGFFIINTNDDYIGDLITAEKNKCDNSNKLGFKYNYFYTQAEANVCKIMYSASGRWFPNPY